jgi:hypothetical protein
VRYYISGDAPMSILSSVISRGTEWFLNLEAASYLFPATFGLAMWACLTVIAAVRFGQPPSLNAGPWEHAA